MPRRYKRKKRYAKGGKRYKKRYKKSTTVGMSNSLGGRIYSPLARTLKVSFKYQDRAILSGGIAGASRVHVLSANGLFDVDITGVGHQPRGFDQLMTMYDHYTVIGASVDVIFSNRDLIRSQLIGISVRDDPTPIADPIDYMEDSYTRFGTAANQGSGGNVRTIKVNLNPNKFLGISKPMAASQVRGAAGSNPIESAYFHCWCAAINKTELPGQCNISYSLNFTAVLTEPKTPGQS